MTKILKTLCWGGRLASFTLYTTVTPARTKSTPVHCQNLVTGYPSGEISKEIKIIVRAAHGVLSGPEPTRHRNILSYCVVLTPLALLPSVDVASGLSQPEISRSALYCPMTWKLPWSLQASWLSPSLGPYGHLPSGPVRCSKGKAHASSKKTCQKLKLQLYFTNLHTQTHTKNSYAIQKIFTGFFKWCHFAVYHRCGLVMGFEFKVVSWNCSSNHHLEIIPKV